MNLLSIKLQLLFEKNHKKKFMAVAGQKKLGFSGVMSAFSCVTKLYETNEMKTKFR